MMPTLLLTLMLLSQAPAAADLNETLWEAARAGDVARIAAALDKGAEVNAKARYNVTALIFAATNGHVEAVRLLVSRGADVNAQDTFYRARAVDMALSNGHMSAAIVLLKSGSQGAEGVLMFGVQTDNRTLVEAALDSGDDVSRRTLEAALARAEREKRSALVPLLKAALDARPTDSSPAFAVDPATLPRFAGAYRDASSGLTMTVTVQDGALVGQVPGQPAAQLVPTAEHVFRVVEANATLTFNGKEGVINSMSLVQGPVTMTLTRVPAEAAAAAPAPAPVTPKPAAPTPVPSLVSSSKPRNWPSFRGDAASGNGDGQRVVSEWDVASGKNIKWKTPIPGIANASPIVWGNRVFVTTAISRAGDSTFRTGLYGDVKPVEDLSEHTWKMYCLDKTTGKVLWEQVAFTGTPKVKRHTKGTQANSTPVTDGRRVVAAFGSPGLLVAWDMNGNELWRADLGTLDSGWFFDPTFQWGHASSPIIYRNSVILQADQQKGSYIAAWDLDSGKERWKTVRDGEISTWGTPVIVRSATGREEIITNGTKIRGYDPETGKLLWTLGPNSEVTVATPVAAHGLVFVTGGYPPVRPVYAIRPGGSGDISLAAGTSSSEMIPWSNRTEGTYIPTPIAYGDHLYTVNNNGVVTAYDARTGQRAFRGRVGVGGTFSASPVAADGRLFFASEDGEVYVVNAGPDLKQIAKNEMKEVIMATPALVDGLIIVRTLGHVYGIGE